MKYPIYRKYFNNKSYFKIISESEFDEVQLVGSKSHFHKVIAVQFPEKLRIKDMIACKNGMWLSIDAEDYEEQLT